MSSATSNLNPVRSTSAELHVHEVIAVGGSSAITKVNGTGPGIAVTRLDTGDYKLTWSQDPGPNLRGVVASLQATTPGDIAGHTVICGAFVAESGSTSATMLVNVYDAADASHDLAALEWFTVQFTAAYTNVDEV